MSRGATGKMARVLALAALGVLPLAGCSTGSFTGAGASAFGNNRLSVAELPNNGTYTRQGAMTSARAHFRNADYGHSAAYYKKVVELDPGNAEAYAGLGASYDRLGRFDLSDRVYSSLHDITGSTAQYYNNVGYSYMLRGNLTAALSNFRKAQAIDPDNPVINNNIQLLSNAVTANA